MKIDYRQFTVLYVDDEMANLMAFRYALESEFRIEIASSAAEALDVLASQEIAVLLADQRMPGMTGAELCGYSKVHFPETMRMIVTAYADITAAAAAVNTGHVFRYIVKPWREEAMADALRGGIEAYHFGAMTRQVQSKMMQAHQQSTTTYLLGRVLHEISSPATAVHMNAHAIQTTLGALEPYLAQAADPVGRQVGDLRLATDDAVASIDQLVARINRFRQGAASDGPSGEASSLAQSARVNAAVIRSALRPRARLVMDLENDSMVAADSVALSQILLNLLSNACEAIPPGLPDENQIMVRVGADASRGWIEVEDTGPGIPPEKMPTLFHALIDGKGESRGMGLAIVREIVEGLGGTITVGPGARGHGTRFVVDLPLADAAVVASKQAAAGAMMAGVAARAEAKPRAGVAGVTGAEPTSAPVPERPDGESGSEKDEG